MGCDCCCASYLAIPVIGFVIYKFFFKGEKSAPQIQETNFKKDVVYLYQFPRSKTVPTPSPFCLKLEAYLRANKIAYENRFTAMGRGKHGLLPFIELNGEHIADSQLIVERLAKQFNVETLSDAREEALSRSLARHMENFTFYVFYKYKIIDHAPEFVSVFYDDAGFPGLLKPLLAPVLALYFKHAASKKLLGALGDFTEAEFELLLRKDLDVLKNVLGKKKYLFGDHVTNADCCAFGVVATSYYQPYSNKSTQILRSDYPEIVAYLENLRQELFPNDFVLRH